MGQAQAATTRHGSDATTRVLSRHLVKEIGERKYDMWFGRSTELRLAGRRLQVRTGSRAAADWIHAHFEAALRTAAREAAGTGEEVEVDVRFAPELGPSADEGGRADADAPTASADRPAVRPRRERRRGGAGPHALPLRHRLDDFVVGASNRLAFGAAARLAEEDEGFLGPLFLYGECGLGKTHLLQGLCRRLLQRRPDAAVRYTTGEQFTNEYIAAVRNNAVDAFRSRIRGLDLLAIDDVHFLANKTQTQSEFLHTLDAIDLHGARVAMASDEHPRHIQRFSRALVSRFLSGVVVEVERPEREMRLELVRRLSSARGLRLNEAAVELIAARCVGSVREIEGALTKLLAMRLVGPDGTSNEVGVVLVERLFRAEAAPSTPLKIESIIDAACACLGVDRSELMGSGRHRRVVLARGVISLLARELTTLSYPEIGRAMGRRNHSTMLTAAKRLRGQLDANEAIEFGAGGETALREIVDQVRHEVLHPARA